MTPNPADPLTDRTATVPAPSRAELDAAVIEASLEAIEAEDAVRLRELLLPLHPAEVAELLHGFARDQRRAVVRALGSDFDPEILAELEAEVRDEVVEVLGPVGLAAAVSDLDSDDAVYVLEDLSEDRRRQVLDAVAPEDRVILEQSLTYPEDTAGRLMQRELVAIPEHWTVGQTIDFLRAATDLPTDFYDLFIVDPRHLPMGALPLSRLLQAGRPVPVAELMETDFRKVEATEPAEEVARLFRKYRLVSLPVTESDGRLVGVITVDDVVEVIEDEAEETIMNLGGVSQDDIYQAAWSTVRSRFTWLFVNLATAFLASSVISAFAGSIQSITALAILMPIVASMGGNAGTQTLTVAVRGLATGELSTLNAARFLGKEAIVGGFNGLLFAVLVGAVAGIWFADPRIGGVIALAMLVNLTIAALAGVSIPVLLDKAGVDPAVASGVFLTTLTDCIGFLAFLGLATWLLL